MRLPWHEDKQQGAEIFFLKALKCKRFNALQSAFIAVILLFTLLP